MLRLFAVAAAIVFAAAFVHPADAQFRSCRSGACSGGSCFGGSCSGGSCSGGVCLPQYFQPEFVATPAAPPPHADGWERHATDLDSWTYFKGGVQAGAYRKSSGSFYRLKADGAFESDPSDPPAGLPREAAAIASAPKSGPCRCPDGSPCTCPDCKCRSTPAENPLRPKPRPHEDEEPPGFGDAGEPNFGIDLARMRDARGSYRVNGRDSTKAKAFEKLRGDAGDEGIPADGKLNRLTAIGTAEQCAPIASDLKTSPALAAERSKVTFQQYRPDDAMVKDIGAAPGAPSIYLQTPGGKVLARWETYPGAEALAGEIRTKDPNYNPANDPQPGKPKPPPAPTPTPDEPKPSPTPASLPKWVWGAASLLFMFLGRKDNAAA